ncbi:hypothetical protein SUDANB105_07450 [Streptomyces sp. enrichment culture]|uniref:hypothetical protein n=1 Tax=Streptomyces sp. enrichment culture TaxID=1795815 RepID=UPI003F5483B3
MPRRPSRPARVLAAAVAAGALLATGACSDRDDKANQSSDASASPTAGQSRAAAPAARRSPSPSPSATLTESGAKTALITEADIEEDWTQVDNAEKWRDGLLIGTVDVHEFVTGKADAADCQRLLDGLYGEDLLGKPSGAFAVTGFEEGDSRLLYQVGTYDQSDLDDSMEWLASLPDECDQFTVTGSEGDERTVEVIETSLPDEGDARQGLEVTVKGTADGEPTTLTMDVAVVRVGTDAITVAGGGLDGGAQDSVNAAVEQGTGRLEDVLAGRTPAASPTPGD